MNDEPMHSGSSSEPTDLLEVVPTPPDATPKHTVHHSVHPVEHENEPPKNHTGGGKSLPPDASFKDKLKHFLREKLTRKEFIIGSVIFVVLLGGAIAFGLSNRAAAPQQAATKPKPAIVITSPLTGLPVTAAQAKRPVTGVMVENSDFARPQSGLGQAGVVFEAIAEAGITRFLALYQEATPSNIGPIRSARPYFLEWALGFNASLAHVGGSPEALNDINAWHVRDIGEFGYGSYYHRISSREAPHNMYTGMAQLNAIEKLNHWTTSHFTGFPRKKDDPAKKPTARRINFNISWSDFAVAYNYDSKKNAYLRQEAGAKHIDANTGKQLEPKVVIGIVVAYNLESDGYHSQYAAIGSGKAYIFQDGKVTIGNWHKPSKTHQITFTTGGKPIKLNAGQTWITALGSANDISYNP
jgi:Protein of unknown function (DUF3048) N-terminal domain/Protein of unknown function (DUF3048) C-terminal domain